MPVLLTSEAKYIVEHLRAEAAALAAHGVDDGSNVGYQTMLLGASEDSKRSNWQ